MFWTLFGFKLVTAIVIFLCYPTAGAAAFLLVLHWFWFIPVIGLGAAAILGWRRLARVRARRQHLIRAEFMLDDR
jgi:hypothetical protein